MPHALLRTGFLLALCSCVCTGFWMSAERIAGRSDLELAMLERMVSGGGEAAPLAEQLQQSPGLQPLLLRRALTEGRFAAALDAIATLPPERQQQLGGWTSRLRDEARDDGVRRLFDRHGRPILAEGAVAAPAELVPQVLVEALDALEPGAAARTTLDLRLSRDLSEPLARAVEGLRSRSAAGTVVVLSAHSGELLAAVSTAPEGPTHQALLQQREPASIAKLITTNATYRAGLDADSEIAAMRCDGAVRFGREPLWCPSVQGALLGLDDAMASSCNVAFAELGRRIGPERLLAEYERFGFRLAGAGEARLGYVPETALSARQFGDLSVGLNHVEITPLHAALLARTMVDGVWRPARLLRSRTGRTGRSARALGRPLVEADPLASSSLGADLGRFDGEVLIEPDVLPLLQRSMRGVVRSGGTANGVAPWGLPVAMKTGTGRTWNEGFHVNYIGYTGEGHTGEGRASAADVAFSVRLVGGRSSRWVRREARQLTAELLRILAQRHRSVPELAT
ncbi:MAG: hypothetical protein DWQ36_17455 [Acidobacteria bacterium]|nr:MAG: hypothetical protein DWQ36_17455 [Acidobacteriota bacterium]